MKTYLTVLALTAAVTLPTMAQQAVAKPSPPRSTVVVPRGVAVNAPPAVNPPATPPNAPPTVNPQPTLPVQPPQAIGITPPLAGQPPQMNVQPTVNNTPAPVPITPVPGANATVVQPGFQAGAVNQNQFVTPALTGGVNQNAQPALNQSVQGAFVPASQVPSAPQTYNQTPVPTNTMINGYRYSPIPNTGTPPMQ